MKIEFYKYQGTGNDFVILDNRDERYSHITGGEVKLLCDRRFGIGADGLMMLNNKKYFDFETLYNATELPESRAIARSVRVSVVLQPSIAPIRSGPTSLAP